MNPFEMVVLIVAIVTLGSIIRGKTGGKRSKATDTLEERIAVLERIVTDPAERTAREIDSLR